MENQVNAGDQNTQQIGQNPTMRPIAVPEKPKVNYWMISTIILLFITLVELFVIMNNKTRFFSLDTSNLASLASKENSHKATSGVGIELPAENTLYLGKYKDLDSIFYTNSHIKAQRYFDPKTDSYTGELTLSDRSGRSPFDFKELQNPQKIFEVKDQNYVTFDVVNFLFDGGRENLYLSINYTYRLNDGGSSFLNKIYIVNIANSKTSELWSHKLEDDKYSQKWAAIIDSVDNNKFLVLSLSCCPTESLEPNGVVVLNIETKSEKYLGTAGNVQFDLTGNTVSFQKLGSFKEPCEDGPGCDINKQRTVFKPTGQVFTEKLP